MKHTQLGWKSVDRIHVTEDTNKRQASVNMVTNLGGCGLDILEKRKISCSSQDSKFRSSSSQEGRHANYTITALR